MKNSNKKKLLRNTFVFITFVKQNKKQKWDEKLINENVMFRSDLSFANLECQEVIRNV
jgi:hypothetical protein